MTSFRWSLLMGLALAAAAPWLTGRSAPDSKPGHRARLDVDRADRALAHASRFLLGQQAPDGARPSDVYGSFKDGASLTPLVVQALRMAPASKKGEAACRRGIDYLETFVRSDGVVQAGPRGFNYPVYTAAGALNLFSAADRSRAPTPRAAWLAHLRPRQLTENLG